MAGSHFIDPKKPAMTDPVHIDSPVAADTVKDQPPGGDPARHRAREFDVQFALLQSRILEGGTCVDAMIVLAVEALINADGLQTREVLHWAETVDQLVLDIESQCLQLTVREQPVGSKLCSVGTALKVVTDLERIGDHAVKLANMPVQS